MTEVPEYLLERSRARRAALGLGGGGEAPAPAGDSRGGDASPATAAPRRRPPAAAPPPRRSAPVGSAHRDAAHLRRPGRAPQRYPGVDDAGDPHPAPVGDHLPGGVRRVEHRRRAGAPASRDLPAGGLRELPRRPGPGWRRSRAGRRRGRPRPSPTRPTTMKFVSEGSSKIKGQPYGDPAREGGQRVAASGGMPSFAGQLTEEEITAVVTLRTRRALEFEQCRPPRDRPRRPGGRGRPLGCGLRLLAGRSGPRRGGRREEALPPGQDLRRRADAPGGQAARRHGPGRRPGRRGPPLRRPALDRLRQDDRAAVARAARVPPPRLRHHPPRPRPDGGRAGGEGGGAGPAGHGGDRAQPRRRHPPGRGRQEQGHGRHHHGERHVHGGRRRGQLPVRAGPGLRPATGPTPSAWPSGATSPRPGRTSRGSSPTSTCATRRATCCPATGGSSPWATGG